MKGARLLGHDFFLLDFECEERSTSTTEDPLTTAVYDDYGGLKSFFFGLSNE